MIDVAGRTVVFIGRLGRLPRRVAARCVSDRGGMARRSLTRATGYVVVGRDASAWLVDNRLKAKLATARHLGAVCLSEGDFLRGLGLLPPLPEEGRTLTLDDLANASGLGRTPFSSSCFSTFSIAKMTAFRSRASALPAPSHGC